MKLKVDFQKACAEETPTMEDFEKWIQSTATTIKYLKKQAEVNIRAVDEKEMLYLNNTFRKKTALTNVLSFPANLPKEIEINLLGDIAICAPVVQKEATKLGKPEKAHWAHLTVHGMLHLIGYDHISEKESVKMESVEVSVLANLGISNPYTQKSNTGII